VDMGWPVCVVSLLCVVVCIHAELVAVGPGGGATAFGGGLRLGTLKPDTPGTTATAPVSVQCGGRSNSLPVPASAL